MFSKHIYFKEYSVLESDTVFSDRILPRFLRTFCVTKYEEITFFQNGGKSIPDLKASHPNTKYSA
jgi:hypothetical protein